MQLSIGPASTDTGKLLIYMFALTGIIDTNCHPTDLPLRVIGY